MTRATRFGVALGIGVVACGAFAVYEFAWSPSDTARATLAGRTLEVHYSAPSVRGRQIFGAGGLLSKDPTYPVWRAGANFATTLRTTGDLDVNGVAVPAGTYTLYIWIEDPDAWQLIVNSQTSQWGRSYDPRRDLGRAEMTMSAPPAPVETLRYELIDKGGGQGELRVAWERHVAAVPFEMSPVSTPSHDR